MRPSQKWLIPQKTKVKLGLTGILGGGPCPPYINISYEIKEFSVGTQRAVPFMKI
jgi:hypothetical protein